ncbi:hypothetical protein CYMTET_3889 [Cymbomonas tetramitiformis]|uniref:Uncharacterized protein n=1 Tax=Cymbomonas tetramitiformis TaxID=36881 RepID=A0AAE0H2K8_9CHLO|nr:hypothetical protein CYMTET_3889 [Cymbomonas tetramitiformis]
MGKTLCRNPTRARLRRRLALLGAHLTRESTRHLTHALKQFFLTPRHERKFHDLAPESIHLCESDATLVRCRSPLHVGKCCTVWLYTVFGESDVVKSKGLGTRFALKVVTKNNFNHEFLDEEASSRSRASMQESVAREVRTACCDGRSVVEHAQLPDDAETSTLPDHPVRPSLLEIEARHAVTGFAHHLVWGAQLMVAADLDAGRFVRNLGASVEYRALELVQLARLTLICMLRLKRLFKMFQVDFKWENCGLYVESDERVSVKLLDTSGVISELHPTKRMTTYGVRSERHIAADETMVVWGFGIALCQLANPNRYRPISKYFKQVADGEPLTAHGVRRAVCPVQHETAEWFLAVSLRCFGLAANGHVPTLRTLQTVVNRHTTRQHDRGNVAIVRSLEHMKPVPDVP